MRSSRRLLLLALTLALAAMISPSAALVEVPFCSEITDITGVGTSSQFAMHYQVTIPAYETRCAKGSDAISYFGANDASTFSRMLNRGQDPDHPDMFWSRDSILTAAEAAQVMGDTGRSRFGYTPIGHFPTFVNGLAVVYNLNCVSTLNLSMANMAAIYLGSITRWNDPQLVADNPGLATCNKAVKLTGRADSAGETTTFKAYMGQRNPVWAAYSQQQLNTQWPSPLVCRGGGDAGAAGCVASNTGSIGYVSILRAKRAGLKVANVERLSYSRPNLLPTDPDDPTTIPVPDPAKLQAPKTDFVAPSTQGCSDAAASLEFPPGFDNFQDWTPYSLVGTNKGYPICFFSFMLVFQRQNSGYSDLVSASQSVMLRDYMRVLFQDKTQKALSAAGYGPLPGNVLTVNRVGVERIDFPDCNITLRAPGTDRNGCFQLLQFIDDVKP